MNNNLAIRPYEASGEALTDGIVRLYLAKR